MPDATRRSPVSLADAILAMGLLRPEDEGTRKAIAQLLGLDAPAAAPDTTRLGTWKPNEGAAPAASGAIPSAALPRSSTPSTATTVALTGARTSVEILPRVEFASDASVGAVDPLDPFAGADASLPPPPLFAPLHSRAIGSAMLTTLVEGTEVDVERVTETLSQGRRVPRIPYRSVPSLRRGAHVLIDRARTMDPLRSDLEHLRTELDRLFGGGRLAVHSFAHVPSARDARRGVWSEPEGRRAVWRPRGRGVPVLVLSDFALTTASDDADGATTAEWLAFAADVRAAHGHPVALAAQAPSRWPAVLTRAMTFVHWSERTTARQVMRALRESRHLGARRP